MLRFDKMPFLKRRYATRSSAPHIRGLKPTATFVLSLRDFHLSLFFALALPLGAQDWPQFLGPNRNGATSDAQLAAQWPKDGPPVAWQRKVGQGFAGPVVSGGRLVLFHRLGDLEVVECLDALTGKEFWKKEYPTHYVDDFRFDPGPRGTPAIAGGRVYTFGAEGTMSCWSLADGAKAWSVDTKKEFGARKGFFGLACSPLVEGNAAIVNIGGKDSAGIVAFDKETGKVLWKNSGDEASYASPVVAGIGGKRIAFVLTREALDALNPADGKSLAHYPWRPAMHASVSGATPLVVGDLIFLTASYDTGATLLRWKEGTFEKVWANDEGISAHYATPVYHDGWLYGFDGRADPGFQPPPSLRCVEFKSGKLQWSEEGLKAGTVTLAGNQLLVLTGDGELIRATATPAGFKAAGRVQILGVEARAHPALADGLFYARSKDKLVCVDLRKKP